MHDEATEKAIERLKEAVDALGDLVSAIEAQISGRPMVVHDYSTPVEIDGGVLQ